MITTRVAGTALVTRWKADTAANQQASPFGRAYTNVQVDRLNAELRQVRRERGEPGSPDVVPATKHGAAAFVVGDRVQFTDTAKKLGVYNSNAGTVLDVDAYRGRVSARLDAPGGRNGGMVTWSAANGF
jgi:ATP-dependent exoDNAse (exonuclease V) alpha subunit